MFEWTSIRESQNKAVKKYISAKFDRQEIYLPKGLKKTLKDHAKIHQLKDGEPGKPGYSPAGSVNAFVNRAIRETMERDNIISRISKEIKEEAEAVKNRRST